MCRRLPRSQAESLGGFIHEFPRKSWQPLLSYHSPIFHRPVTSAKPHPHHTPLKGVAAKRFKEPNSRYESLYLDKSTVLWVSVLTEPWACWMKHLNVESNVSHNTWRWEPCWLNLAARKMYQWLALQTEFTLNGVPPWWSTMMSEVSQGEVTLPGAFSLQTMLVFPDRYQWKGSVWTGLCASNAMRDMQSPATELSWPFVSLLNAGSSHLYSPLPTSQDVRTD